MGSVTVVATPEGGHRMGNPNAPIKLVEYGSRGCPVCGRFAAEGMEPLRTKYISTGKVSYEPNTMNNGCPFQAAMADGGFHTHEERIDAKKVRARSASFHDHFSQATLFFNSQSEAEKKHLVDALRFELGKVKLPAIRERMVGILTQIDATLASKVAAGLGMPGPLLDRPQHHAAGHQGSFHRQTRNASVPVPDHDIHPIHQGLTRYVGCASGPHSGRSLE